MCIDTVVTRKPGLDMRVGCSAGEQSFWKDTSGGDTTCTAGEKE
jgi:hypothetical protein